MKYKLSPLNIAAFILLLLLVWFAFFQHTPSKDPYGAGNIVMLIWAVSLILFLIIDMVLKRLLKQRLVLIIFELIILLLYASFVITPYFI